MGRVVEAAERSKADLASLATCSSGVFPQAVLSLRATDPISPPWTAFVPVASSFSWPRKSRLTVLYALGAISHSKKHPIRQRIGSSHETKRLMAHPPHETDQAHGGHRASTGRWQPDTSGTHPRLLSPPAATTRSLDHGRTHSAILSYDLGTSPTPCRCHYKPTQSHTDAAV